MANGKIERFHRELGKMARIHQVPPDVAVIYIRTHEHRMKFFTHIAFDPHNLPKPEVIYDGNIHDFKEGDIVWKFVPRISRKKWDQVYVGPYVIKQLKSDRTMIVGDYKQTSPDVKVHYADLKKCHLPNKDVSTTWRLHHDLFKSTISEWAQKYSFPLKFTRRDTLCAKAARTCKNPKQRSIYHYATVPFSDEDIQEVYNFFTSTGVPFLAFVCPELPCLSFWKQVESWPAKWVALPGRPDDLLCLSRERGRRPVGRFPWTMWMVCLHQ